MTDTSTTWSGDLAQMPDDDLLMQINAHDPYDVEFARRFRAQTALIATLRAELSSGSFYDA